MDFGARRAAAEAEAPPPHEFCESCGPGSFQVVQASADGAERRVLQASRLRDVRLSDWGSREPVLGWVSIWV